MARPVANPNAVVLDASAWVDPDRWDVASPTLRRRYLNMVGDRAAFLLRSQLRRGIGADGAKLWPVKPASRPDGAKGPPLDPHYGESRSVKNLAISAGVRGGRVTLWWRGGWGIILGYHQRGEVRGAPVRDVIGLSPASTRKLKTDARSAWRALDRPRPHRGEAAPQQDEAIREVEQRTGLRFVRPTGRTLVAVDVGRLDRALAEDAAYFVGPGGVGPSAKPGAYERAKEFLAKARREGIAIAAPEAGIGTDGMPFLGDGRHRWAVLRDEGHAWLVVAVPRGRAATFARRFGTVSRRPAAPPRQLAVIRPRLPTVPRAARSLVARYPHLRPYLTPPPPLARPRT